MFLLGVVSPEDVLYFSFLILGVFLLLLVGTVVGWWLTREHSTPSPYTGKPLRLASDIHWMTREKVLRYLYNIQDYYNRMIDFDRSAYCRETGRLFPDCITWYGTIKVDWNFIQKRCPGNFVSWGSLSEEQQLLLRDKHKTLDGFQAETSSPVAAPRKVTPEYANTKPGPLYVDVETGMIAGWKCIPDTELEVFVIQKPIEQILPGIHKKYRYD